MPAPALRRILAAVALLAAAAAAFLYWQSRRPPPLPEGFTYANGRLEATEVDVAAKASGRLTEVTVREGDRVERGQVLARRDVQDLSAQHRAALEAIDQARHARQEAFESVRGATSQVSLARSNLARDRQLVKQGFLSPQQLERSQNAMDTAEAALAAARQRVEQADAQKTAAADKADAVKAVMDDATLRSPIAGRVLYRLAEPGEVLGEGGKALTLIDTGDMFMTLFLPESQAGRVQVGGEARIVLDAWPDEPVPALVSFVSPRNQFTPKEVETRNERDKMMFRIKLRVAPEWLASHPDVAKPGMPGIGYVRLDPGQPWPARLPSR